MSSRMRFISVALMLAIFAASGAGASEQGRLRLLIIDGQNNHGTWPKTTSMMKKYFEDTGRFDVDVARTAFTHNGEEFLEQYSLPGIKTIATKSPQTDPNYRPDFSAYDVVVSNFGYGAARWPEQTQADFEKYVRDGGGFVVVHAADNSFGDWPEYNEMIGVGGWGGRSEKSGPYVYFNAAGEQVRDTEKGPTGSHGPQHPFPIVIRDPHHPITEGMPQTWMHKSDELYDFLRGPAKNMKVLATAYSAKEKHGSGNHVPMLIAIRYGLGRVFHTPMGHDDRAMQCAGFATALTRGAEWAATGKVTIPIPGDFPTPDSPKSRGN